MARYKKEPPRSSPYGRHANPRPSSNTMPLSSSRSGGELHQQAQRGKPNSHFHSNPRNIPVHDRHERWKSWCEVKLRIPGLPACVDTLILYNKLKRHGHITWIDIREGQSGRRMGEAFVTFTPPPPTAFWERQALRVDPKDGTSPVECPLVIVEPRFSTYQDGKRIVDKIMIPASSLDFGIMFDKDEMMVMRSIRAQPNTYDIMLMLNLIRKEIVVFFEMPNVAQNQGFTRSGNAALKNCFKFTISLQQLTHVWETEITHDQEGSPRKKLVIPLDLPPRFFRKLVNVEGTHCANAKSWTDRLAWSRQTDIVTDRDKLNIEPLTVRKPDAVIDIAQWNTYQLTFDSGSYSHQYRQFREALEQHNVQVLDASKTFRTIRRINDSVWDVIDQSQSNASRKDSGISDLAESSAELSYPVRYQLEVCISHGFLNAHNITRDFVERLAQLDERSAVRRLENVAEARQRIYNPMDIFDMAVPQSKVNKLPSYCVYAQSAIITPSATYINTPTVETSNRIVREYREHCDRFLRVKFTGESYEGRIWASDDDTYDQIYTRVFRCLKNGIRIGDRHYQYLAMGNAQFREHGAYFFASTPYLTAAEIRYQMGDFKTIRLVSKYASRMGQCFSTTRAISMKVQVVEFEDVERNGYNFTDGIGKISPFLAQCISRDLGLLFTPSAFQIRLGGCKGMVAVDPGVAMLEVWIRRSQYKFAAKHNGLEIIRWSSFASATLNRQLIMVLQSLDIPDSTFANKMENELQCLDQAMVDEPTALQKLQSQVDFNQMTLAIASIMQDGFFRAGDPFTRSILHLWRAYSMKALKEKAGLPIQDSAFVLGVSDETATLRGHFEGDSGNLPEIFLQIDKQNSGFPEVIEGICIVARNPSLHPGDIRTVRAVNCDALKHLSNVVVFPQTGDRDVPNMCSGGDLDGDDFVVIWDPQLIPENGNREAMDFKAPKASELERDVFVEDIFPFFVNYMKTDSLGAIAVAHLAQSDLQLDGVASPQCLELAKLHSLAVDYPKSGVPAKMPGELRPRKYPHFMQRRDTKQQYTSYNILGRLYDMVETDDFRPFLDSPFDQRVLGAFDEALGGSQEMLSSARELKSEYDEAMRRIMAQHEIRTEFEVWTTLVLSHAKHTKDYHFHEEIGRLSHALKERFQNACSEKAGDNLEQFVVAMYKVTADEAASSLEPRILDLETGNLDYEGLPFISFPWLFPTMLGRIARKIGNLPAQSVRQLNAAQRRRATKPEASGVLDISNDIETATGTAHEGDVLELFQDDFEHIAMVESGITQLQNVPKSKYTSDPIVRLPSQSPTGSINGSKVADPTEHVEQTQDVSSDTSSAQEKDEEMEVEVEIDDKPSALERLAALVGLD